MTLYLEADSGLSSTLIFTILAASPVSADSSSRMGAIILQGPHQGAQKSTSTIPASISLLKVASEICLTDMANSS